MSSINTSFSYTQEIQAPLDFPDNWWELYENADWPAQVDVLTPENISRATSTLSPSIRDPNSWIYNWFGIGTTESTLARMVLQDILGYNPYQYWHQRMSLILWWHINAGDTNEYEAHALNEMTYRLGYTDYEYIDVDHEWTGIPF